MDANVVVINLNKDLLAQMEKTIADEEQEDTMLR